MSPSIDASTTCAQLAEMVCDSLVADSHLDGSNERQRNIRQEALEKIFADTSDDKIDGAYMISLDNPGPLGALVRNKTSSQVWVEYVIAALTKMLPPSVQERAPIVEPKFDQKPKSRTVGGKKGNGKNRGYDDGDQQCYNCWEWGHISTRCTQPPSGKGKGGKGEQKCFNCNQSGHLARDCPQQPRAKGKGGGKLKDLGNVECYNCHGKGHFSRDCPRQNQPGGPDDY